MGATSCGRRTFTYLPVVGWGWYSLSTVLDDYSRGFVPQEATQRLPRGSMSASAKKRTAGTTTPSPVR